MCRLYGIGFDISWHFELIPQTNDENEKMFPMSVVKKAIMG